MAANNHFGGYGPGTVDIFRENMNMEKLYFKKLKRMLIEKLIKWYGDEIIKSDGKREKLTNGFFTKCFIQELKILITM